MRVRVAVSATILAAFFALFGAAGALAQDRPDYVGSRPSGGSAEVSGSGSGSAPARDDAGGRGSEGSTGVSGTGSERAGRASGTLPLTGADITLIALVGLGATAVGLILVRASRGRVEDPATT